MKKVIGLILLAVVASAGCTGEAKTEKGTVTPTSENSPSTTSTMQEVSGYCALADTNLMKRWATSDAIDEKAWSGGVANNPAVKGASAEAARSNVEATRKFITLCGAQFPPSKTAEYERRIEKAMLNN